MKTYPNDIFIQTRSVLNELKQASLDYEDSIMSILVLLFIIVSHKKKWIEPEHILNNDGYDFFNDLELRANDPEDNTHHKTILLYLRKLEPYKDVIIRNHLIQYYYNISHSNKLKLVQQLIDELSNGSKVLYSQISNDSINKVFSKLVNIKQYSRILDPCIGSGKLIVELYKKGTLDSESVEIVGVEKNSSLALLAYINLTLNGFKYISIHNEDALDYLLLLESENLLEERFDLIVSDLPIGLTLKNKRELAPGIPSTLRFYYLLIQQCRKGLAKEGQLYITSNSGLVKRFRSLAEKIEDFSIISVLIDASETANWSYTNAKPYILVLDKEAHYVDAEMHLTKLNPEGDTEQLNIIDRDEFDFFSHVENLEFFFSDAFDRIYHEGMEKFDTLSKYFRNTKKSRMSLEKNSEMKDSILSKEFIQETSGFRSITNFSLEDPKPERFRTKYIAKAGDWVLAHYRGEIKILISEVDGVVLPLNCIALEPTQCFTELMQDWLIAQFRNEFLQTQLLATIRDSRPGLFGTSLKLNKLFIDQHTPDQKERFVSEWKEARIELLEIEKKKVESKFADVKEQNIEEQIDLVHDLHHSLKNELSIITGAAKSIKAYLERKSASSEPVSLDDPSREPRKGADPRLQKSVGERLMALLSVSEEMTTYLNHYKTILKFDPSTQKPEWIDIKKYFNSIFSEFSGFSYKVIEKVDQLESKKSKDFHLKCDKSVLRLVLTNIISNAQKYGFTEGDIQYSFHVDIQEIPFDNASWVEKYPNIELSEYFLRIRLSNDGKPLSDSIDESEFFRKGFKYGANAGSGLGSDHIKKGIESMGGFGTLNNPKKDDPYNFQLEFFFPYPIYKTKNELIEEGILA